MGLITKFVMQKWHPKTKKHYEDKGYKYTKIKDMFKVKCEDLTNGSHMKVSVICDNPNCTTPISKLWSWEDYIKQVKEDGKCYCSKCSNKLFGKTKANKTKMNKSKTFKQWCEENNHKDVLNRWDYNKNKLKPEDILFGTSAKYWFKCPKGIHESELKQINNYVNGHEGVMDCIMCNSLGFLYPKSLNYWSDKNKSTPFSYSIGSHAKVYWKCIDKKHIDFKRDIWESIRYEFRCPECSGERDESILQGKVRLYLEGLNIGEILHEWNCNIVPKNPKISKGNGTLPFDNEVVSLKLIIEVHGSQHYKICSWYNELGKKHNKTPEYELHYRKLKDRYKKFISYKRGFNYLEIPFWTDNKDEEWKKLINKKINEILIKLNKDISFKEVV